MRSCLLFCVLWLYILSSCRVFSQQSELPHTVSSNRAFRRHQLEWRARKDICRHAGSQNTGPLLVHLHRATRGCTCTESDKKSKESYDFTQAWDINPEQRMNSQQTKTQRHRPQYRGHRGKGGKGEGVQYMATEGALTLCDGHAMQYTDAAS